ncbi:unnamed protein product [Rotaria sp. Silwood2]|nr:unnamed protein product [Rotaria sp. Silwood2]
MFSTSKQPASTKTSQIFNLQYFQQILNNVHVCSNDGRLEFMPDALLPVGLFHNNILRCTKCHKEIPTANFPLIKPIESEQQEPNKRLTIAAATIGIGYNAVKGIMSTLYLSMTTEKAFLRHLHKLFQRSLINGLRYKYIVCDDDASAYEAVKYHYIGRQQQT